MHIRRTLRTALLALVLTLCAGTGALAAAGPVAGRYSGTGRKGTDRQAQAPLKISFVLKGNKVSRLTIGPATFACDPRSESGLPTVKVKLPKVTTFPTEKLEAGPEYNYSFVRKGKRMVSSHSFLIPQGPLFFSLDGIWKGKSFGDAEQVAQIYFGADTDGKVDAAGPLECIGTYDGYFMKRS
jgi:hypothetical protein